MTKFEKKAILLEVANSTYEYLLNEKKRTAMSYEIVGKSDNQKINYKTGELLWEDDEKTIPLYENKWDYVEIPEENLTDRQKEEVIAIEKIIAMLEKLI